MTQGKNTGLFLKKGKRPIWSYYCEEHGTYWGYPEDKGCPWCPKRREGNKMPICGICGEKYKQYDGLTLWFHQCDKPVSEQSDETTGGK